MADWQVFSFHSFSWESSPRGTLHVDCNSVWGELITKVTIVLTSWWEYASKQDNISSAIYIYIIQTAPVYASGGMASCVTDWHGICIWTSPQMSEVNILSSSRTSHIDMKSWSWALLVTKNWSSISSLNQVFFQWPWKWSPSVMSSRRLFIHLLVKSLDDAMWPSG